MNTNTQKLRDLIRQACPLPWMLATSNSWRRIVDPYHVPVCSPCNQPDGHPDLAFPGGPEGPTATLLIEAANALPGLLDTLDAQAAEIAGLKSQVEMLEACAAGDAALTEGQQREIARLREALDRAATSLNTIATLAGSKDDYMEDMFQVRGYAHSRARVARAALAQEGS